MIEKALFLIERNALLKEIVQIEPCVKTMLLEAAREVPTPGTNRWEVYSRLKRQFTPYVGWHARNLQLSTSAHYTAFMDFLDALLPEFYDTPDYEALAEVKR